MLRSRCVCDDPLSNVREMVRKHAKQYSNEIDCTCTQEPTFLCKALPSRAKMDEHGNGVTSRRRPRCAWPGVLPPAWAVVTGLEWARDAERCWCGATCPLRRRHTCRPRWWALLHRRPHLSSCSSQPVLSPSPPSYDHGDMHAHGPRAASGGQLEQWPQLRCVRMSELQWRPGCVGVALC